eukprot:6204911-Pleurochrysis_carterae.AAC.1
MTSTGSRNPVSRRTGESTANVSSEEAIKEIDAFAAKIKAEGCTEARAELRNPPSSASREHAATRTAFVHKWVQPPTAAHAQSHKRPSLLSSCFRSAAASRSLSASECRAACLQEVFARYAQQRSDCGSFKSGGDLGVFGPGEMQAQFEQGCAATPVGTMSDVVLSDSGYHLIFRTR